MGSILIHNSKLFSEVLLKPALEEGADQLLIVSGYASASMSSSYLETLLNYGKQINLSLIVGMVSRDGLSKSDHEAFIKLTRSTPYCEHFRCNYVIHAPSVHSKVYCWLKDQRPYKAFTGSANFTQNGFLLAQDELLVECDAKSAYHYYEQLVETTASCTDAKVEDHIQLHQFKRSYNQPLPAEVKKDGYSLTKILNKNSLSAIELSLLDSRTQQPHAKAGLNWGQREGREPNQAYIPVPKPIQDINFFPAPGEAFNLLTDDGKSILCKCAGTGGKNLESSESNSLLGQYFRSRLRLASGAPVTLQDLLDYGRTTVSITKLDEANYFLDFSAHVSA